MEIENFIRFVVIIFAVGLFVVASYLYLTKAVWPASSAMGFVFLLVVALTISNYKRIKGFGFEAEMWDEKQVQAARLVDRLELLSRATTRQVGMIASKLGLWDSGLSNVELADMIDVTRKILESNSTSDVDKNNTLAPLYERVALNYVGAARQLVERELQKVRAGLDESRKIAAGDAIKDWSQKVAEVDDAIKKEREADIPDMINRRSIQPLLRIATTSQALRGHERLFAELEEISTDLAYFEANRSLRRNIDWRYLYK